MIDDKLQEVNMTVEDPILGYFGDSYALGETKEQIQIGNEVEAPKSETITINTSDSIEQTERTYTLTVPNPDRKIFSIGIDGMEKTFKIGFFNNTPIAYSTLETELQTWLGENYIINYVSGTTYNIRKYDGSAISKTNPNLVRSITLSGFDSISKITVIVDGTSVLLDGATHGGSINNAIDYLITQLSSSTYHMINKSSKLIIARKDGAIPVITKTQYDKYTYSISYFLGDVGLYPDYTTLTVAGTNYTYDYTGISHQYQGNNQVSYFSSNISGYTISNINVSGTFNTWSSFDLRKSDHSQVSISSINHYTDSFGTPVGTTDSIYTTITETNHKADITVTTYTEITITLSASGNNYFIPVGFNPVKIEITAESSVGRSTGVWEGGAKRGAQSCNSSVSGIVADKVFQTNASNYGSVLVTKRGGFTMSWTTNTANKLLIKCS